MSKMKVAIVGGGIVGATAAFYASQIFPKVDLYDDGVGQATKASAGIICPWFSKRRNKAWYRLANLGAHFYPDLLQDLKALGHATTAYEQRPTWLLKKRQHLLPELEALVEKRKAEAPLIKTVKRLGPEEQKARLKAWTYEGDVLAIEKGAAILDGEAMVNDLLAAAQEAGLTYYQKKAQFEVASRSYRLNGTTYDAIIFAAGAWLAQCLAPLNITVDVRPQKGALAYYDIPVSTWPLIMPEGEADIIPHGENRLYIGATHDDDKGFDLTAALTELKPILSQVAKLLPELDLTQPKGLKVGTRAYTSDYAPFFGPVPGHPKLLVASGLGASGLTTGPLIGRELVRLLAQEETQLALADYDPARYIKAQA